MLRGGLGQAACVYVSVKDIARALFSLGYLRDARHGTLDEAVVAAYGEWYSSSGIESFFGLNLDAVTGSLLVQVCPTEAWTQLQAQAQLDAEVREGPVADSPTSSIPPVTITPGPIQPSPPQHVEAGTVSVGWLFLLGGVAGFGTWLVMRKVY